MLRKFLVLFVVLLLPLSAHGKQSSDIGKYLIGTWKVEGIKKGNKGFQPPPHAIKWTFKSDGILVEELGKNGAKINWHYRVIGHDIKVKLGHIAFTWKILGMEDKVMLIKTQLGLLKARHM